MHHPHGFPPQHIPLLLFLMIVFATAGGRGLFLCFAGFVIVFAAGGGKRPSLCFAASWICLLQTVVEDLSAVHAARSLLW